MQSATEDNLCEIHSSSFSRRYTLHAERIIALFRAEPPFTGCSCTVLEHWQTLRQEMQFATTLISRAKFPGTLEDADLAKAVRARFDGALPLQYIDCVFVQSLRQPPSPAELEGSALNEGSAENLTDGRASQPKV